MTVSIAAALAGVAVAVLVVEPNAVLRRRLGVSRASPLPPVHRSVIIALGSIVAVLLVIRLGDRPHLILNAATAIAIACAAVALRRRTTRRARRYRRQAETVEICDAFVSELSVGSPPSRMLAHVATDWPLLEPVSRAADLGGDVAPTLRLLATTPGHAALRDVAAAWEVSTRSGAGLADVLDRLSRALRADDEARQEVIASLAAPRATARVLAVLPLFGLALGGGIGGDPVGVLFGTMIGAGCLAVGSALAISGLFWVEHIADAAEVG